jgi:uncharacterized protein YdhG (YjbR/CyaY superfamily)
MHVNKPATIDEYINGFPEDVKIILIQLNSIIENANVNAVACISYGMPAYKYKGKPLVYFAAFKNHIGLYPTAAGIKAVESELSKYKYSKGAIQFPIDKKIPVALIKKIVRKRTAQIDAP